MPQNFFTDEKLSFRTIPAIEVVKTDGGASPPIIKFPTNLGVSVGNADVSAVPFVVFSPYRRARVLESGASLYTLSPATVLDQLPTPEQNIVLPLPSSALTTSYSVKYDAENLGTGFGALSSGLKRVYESATTNGGFDQQTRDSGLQLLGEQLTQFLKGGLGDLGESIFKSGAATKTATELALGIVDNPFTEYMFKNVDFRTHTFNFTFIPRNLEESRVIDAIVQYFKFYMLPAYQNGITENTVGAAFFAFPYEWQIVQSTQETTFRLLPSVLETFDVDYGSGLDSPKFFYDQSTGKRYPSRIDLKMAFKEIILLTRDRIATEQQENVESLPLPTVSGGGTTQTNPPPKFKRYRF